MDIVPVAAPHRRGRRTLLIPAASGARAPMADVMEVAADGASCADVATTAWSTTREVDPDTGDIAVQERQRQAWSGLIPDVLLEVRRPVSHRHMRSFAGLTAAPTEVHGHRSVWFESLNELAHYRDMFMSRSVTQFASQPLRLTWTLPSGIRTHVPDAVRRDRSGRTTLIDVTTASKVLDPAVMAVFALTAATAAAAGWDYELRTELPQQRVRNVSFLRACRLGRPPLPATLAALATVNWPAQARTVCAALERAGRGEPELWRCVALGLLYIDLDSPIRPDSVVDNAAPPNGRRPSWLVEI